jgi:hypothetical protein
MVGCSAATHEPLRCVESGPAPEQRITCHERVRQVEPLPVGEVYDRFVWQCLIEHQFDAYVWERQTCSIDADCTVVETFCPFGCGAAVAKSYAQSVALEHDRLRAEYTQRAHCMYKCGPVVSAACVQRRCTARGR